MGPKRKIRFLSLIVFLSAAVVVLTLCLIVTLNELAEEKQIAVHCGYHQEIYRELANLPEAYKMRPKRSRSLNLDLDSSSSSSSEHVDLWKEADSWVSKNRIVDFQSPHLGPLLEAMKTARVVGADVEARGSQLKLLLTLDGGQKVIFKPKRYEKDHMTQGGIYEGFDRWGSEIVAFYMSGLLDIPYTPVSVARTVSLQKEIVPVATKRLLNTMLQVNNRTCVYGECYRCNSEKFVCDDSNYLLPGAVSFYLKQKMQWKETPWERNANTGWETSRDYCERLKGSMPEKTLLDLIDASIFDFLIQNGDRHHLETLHDNVVLLDNGKSFGNPHVNHLDILAPMYQCCMLRAKTLDNLRSLTGGHLSEALEKLPDMEELISKAHLRAMEERLLMVFAAFESCKKKHDKVLR